VLPPSFLQALRDCSRDDAAYERLVAVASATFETEIDAYRVGLARLEEAKRFLDQIAITLPDLIYVFDIARGRNIFVNREIAAVLGYDASQIEAMGSEVLQRLVHPEDLARVLAHLDGMRTAADDATAAIEYRMQTRNGEWLWLHSRERVFARDAAGVVKQILGIAKDVTAIKRDEERRIIERAESDSFFDLALDLWCIADTDGRFRRVNRAWENLLGHTTEELAGMRFLDFVHPDDMEATLQAVATISTQTPVLNFINRYRAKDGTYHTIEWRSQPYGNLIFAAARDITRRVQMQEALQESELRYRSLVTATSEGIVLQRADGSIETCNAAAERILGLTAEEMAGRSSIDPRWRAVHEDNSDFPGDTHPSMVALRTGEPVSNVIMGVHKPDGTLTWILINARPLIRPGETTPHAVVTSFTDITMIKLMEEELHRSESRLRSMFETVQDVMWSVELPSMNMSYLNPAAASIFGRPLTDFYHDRDLITHMAHPEDAARVAQAYPLVLRDGSLDWEYRIIRPDGEVRWIYDRAWLVRDAGGAPLRIEGILSDITERRLLEQQKLELGIERERVKLLNDFIANTSHELRTPLAAIATGVYLMARSDDPARRAERAAQIDRQVNTLNNMIGQLQDMVRLDQLAELPLEPLAPDVLVSQIVSAYRQAHPDARIRCDIGAGMPRIAASADYLYTALYHLLDNALRHAPAGHDVAVRVTRSADEVQIDVHNDGPGIDAEHLPHLFEHFYKVSEARTRDDSGTGMGLSIVRRIMALHGGTATVASAPGMGSTFTLHVPVVTSPLL
jgi:PAS domain S-box-containing protein